MDKQLVLANSLPPVLGFDAQVGYGHPILVYLDHIVNRYPDFAGVTYFISGDAMNQGLAARLEHDAPRTGHLANATVEVSLTPLPYGPVLAILTSNVGGCTSTVTALGWKALFSDEPPPTLRVPVQPLYAVTRERILERSPEFYQNLHEETTWGDLITPKVVQALWPYIFGGSRLYPSWL